MRTFADMKIFLVVYDRTRGELVEIEEYDFYDRALEARLRLEIEQRHRLQGREIVLSFALEKLTG